MPVFGRRGAFFRGPAASGIQEVEKREEKYGTTEAWKTQPSWVNCLFTSGC